jgi:hypothetical protein
MFSEIENRYHTSGYAPDAKAAARFAILQTDATLEACAKKGFSPVNLLLVRPVLLARSHHIILSTGVVGMVIVRIPMQKQNNDAVTSTSTIQISVFMGGAITKPYGFAVAKHAHIIRESRTTDYVDVFDAASAEKQPQATFFAVGVGSSLPNGAGLELYLKDAPPATSQRRRGKVSHQLAVTVHAAFQKLKARLRPTDH